MANPQLKKLLDWSTKNHTGVEVEKDAEKRKEKLKFLEQALKDAAGSVRDVYKEASNNLDKLTSGTDQEKIDIIESLQDDLLVDPEFARNFSNCKLIAPLLNVLKSCNDSLSLACSRLLTEILQNNLKEQNAFYEAGLFDIILDRLKGLKTIQQLSKDQSQLMKSLFTTLLGLTRHAPKPEKQFLEIADELIESFAQFDFLIDKLDAVSEHLEFLRKN